MNRRFACWYTLLPLALAACSARGEGTPSTPRLDAGTVVTDAGPARDAGVFTPFDAGECADVVDVVFVLDVSSSMGFVLEALEEDIEMVVTAATALAPDPHFGFIGFADNHAMALGGELEEGRVHTTAGTLQAAFREYLRTYTEANRNPGDGPSGPVFQNPVCEENSLDALYAAASDFPWRESATRVIILVTDDTFLERPDNYGDGNGNGEIDPIAFPPEGDYPAARTAAETIAVVQEAKARVFAFTRLTPPSASSDTRCGTDRRLPWSDITDGWSTPYSSEPAIPEATDGRNYDVDRVRTGELGLADTINEVVVESYCDPPLI